MTGRSCSLARRNRITTLRLSLLLYGHQIRQTLLALSAPLRNVGAYQKGGQTRPLPFDLDLMGSKTAKQN